MNDKRFQQRVTSVVVATAALGGAGLAQQGYNADQEPTPQVARRFRVR